MAYIKQINVGGTAYDIKAAADASGNIIADTYVKKSGDTMTGSLILNSTTSQSPAMVLRTPDHDLHFVIYGNGTKGLYAKASTDTSYHWMLGMDNTNVGIFTDFHAPSNSYYIRNIGYGTTAPYESQGSDGDIYFTYI